MPIVFVDESGNTGTDLLNKEQPILVIASHDLTEADSRVIHNAHFAKDRAPSLKFSRMKERPAGQAAILSFINALKPQQERTVVFAAHKAFALVCKIVDLVIEPSMYDAGLNLYDKGGNIALSNLLWCTLKDLATSAYRDRIMEAFYKLFQNPNHVSVAELERILDEKTRLMSRKKPKTDPLAKALNTIQLALFDLRKKGGINVEKDDLSFYFAGAVLVMAEWGIRHGGAIDLIHDQSTTMASRHDLWEKIVSKDASPAVIGMDRRTMKFPIGVESTRFEKDQDWAGLQLADILAGSMRTVLEILWQTRIIKNEFEAHLIKAMEGWTLVDRLVPEQKFSPKDLGTDGPPAGDPFKYYEKLMS